MDAKLAGELQQKYVETQAQLQNVQQQIVQKQRAQKLAEATEKQLHEVVSDDNTTVWQGVGKMFMGVPLKDYKKTLKEEEKSLKETLDALGKKLNYYETTNENLTRTINKIAGNG